MKTISIPAHDFYRISEYDSLNMLSHLEQEYQSAGAAKADLKALKAKGATVAQDEYCEGLFITKYHYNKRGEEYLLSISYL